MSLKFKKLKIFLKNFKKHLDIFKNNWYNVLVHMIKFPKNFSPAD